MKVVILAGGFGTRISEESKFVPKPMVQLGGIPILVHIMKHYFHYGYDEFIICSGYKQNVIKEYFANYFLNSSDISFDFTGGDNNITIHETFTDRWKVTIADTGLYTNTGGRLKRVKKYIGDEPFMLTYGDGLSDINLNELEQYHISHGKMVTLSAYNVGQRFGVLDVADDGNVLQFKEKIGGSENLINIGFMVCQPEFIDLIEGDEVMLERGPLENVASMNELAAFRHDGFWQCMDTVREKDLLEKMWESGNAPWKIW